jgi:hypothetical protein
MTDLATIVPTKYKTIVGLVGSVVTFVVPLIVSVQDYLPAPWPAVLGVALSILTALGIYTVPFKPSGTTLAPDTPAVQVEIQKSVPGPHTTPWE